MAHTTARQPVTRFGVDGHRDRRADTLAVEEPLEIRIDDEPFTVTMRTPGHDLDLALGFLVAEGPCAARRTSSPPVTAPTPPATPTATPPTTRSRSTWPPASSGPSPRHRIVSSACGVCGTASIDAVAARSPYVLGLDEVRLDVETLAGLPARMRTAQAVFERTGGLHAAALFSADGRLLCLREDVGRHNAVDKVIGWAFTQGRLPLRAQVLQVSGRASFELVQKAWMAGCPVLAAVSAPSSLAADLAAAAGMTLIGFSRGERFSVYSGAERVLGG